MDATSAKWYRAEHAVKWLQAMAKNGGSLLIGAHEQQAAGLYHLGALWARERGLIVQHGTVDVISDKPRRYAYSLTEKGWRAARFLRVVC